ncbi:MAG: translation initiation factor IF-2 [Candidatus Azosocius agrarius]|nr:MAG: translation initiation factor IF-2 [Gammaproteobacteria bacterium]
MVDITVEQLAKQIGCGISSDVLITQLKKAGININLPSDTIKEEEKIKLLHMLKKEQQDLFEKNKQISFKRTTASSINLKASSGKNIINVTYKKSYTYIKKPLNSTKILHDNIDKNIDNNIDNNINNNIDNNTNNDINNNINNDIKKKFNDGDKKFINSNKNDDIKNNSKINLYKNNKNIIKPLINIPQKITMFDLAKKMSVKISDIITHMIHKGYNFTFEQTLDQNTALLIVKEMGYQTKFIKNANIQDINSLNIYTLKPRNPIITIMGHVDHGKTTLIDYIRKSSLIKDEHGGITQHIGAYNVNTIYGNMTFLDTPGHEAFKAMRSHGSKCTDIIVIIVAADDGVMPQTKEAINHAKEANVPIIIAINKIDKSNSDIKKIINELSHFDLISDSWGGDTIFVNISAKLGTGVNTLLENINLQSELLELKAHYEGNASGFIIESRMNQWKGPITSVIIQNGQLSKDDIILSGSEYGKIKEIIDDKGISIKHAFPSMVVDIIGLQKTLISGDNFITIKDEKIAKNIANIKQNEKKEIDLIKNKRNKIEDLIKNTIDKDTKNLNIILKTDVYGSIDAIVYLINNIHTNNINIKIINASIGSVNETDIHLAVISNSIIIAFNVKCTTNAKKMLEYENIKILSHNIVYDIVDNIKEILEKNINSVQLDKKIGVLIVKEIFKSQKFDQIIGCFVTSGIVKKHAPITIIRANKTIYKGEIESLKRFKEDVLEVKVGNTCGIGIKNYNDIKINDTIEIYEKIINKK